MTFQRFVLTDLNQENALSSSAKKSKAAKEQPVSNREQNQKPKKLFDQIIFGDWCKSCGLCAAFCPQKVIGRDDNSGAPVIENPDACIGCRFCELHCPDFAITIKERGEDSRRDAS